jgi:hypothetical protein
MSEGSNTNNSLLYQPWVVKFHSHVFWILRDEGSAWKTLENHLKNINTKDSNQTPRPVPLVTFAHAKLHHQKEINPEKLSIEFAVACSIVPCAERQTISFANGEFASSNKETSYGTWTIRKGPPEDKIVWNATDNRGHNFNPTNLNGSKQKARPKFDYDLGSQDYQASDISMPIANVLLGNVTTMIFQTPNTGSLGHLKNESTIFVAEDTNNSQWSATNINLKRVIQSGGLPWIIPRIINAFNRELRYSANETINGKPYLSQNFVQINWEWLILPTLVVLFGEIFAFLTIWTSHRHRAVLWKESSLPLIYYGDQIHGTLERSSSVASAVNQLSSMEMLAKTTRAKVVRDETTGEIKFIAVRNEERLTAE